MMAEMSVSKSDRDSLQTPHEYPFHPDRKTLTWQRLESMRLHSLGLGNRYSRHFNVRRESNHREKTDVPFVLSCSTSTKDTLRKKNMAIYKNNSLAPFATVGKPTCGYFFNNQTIHKKVNFGIPASDLVKWRNFPTQSSH